LLIRVPFGVCLNGFQALFCWRCCCVAVSLVRQHLFGSWSSGSAGRDAWDGIRQRVTAYMGVMTFRRLPSPVMGRLMSDATCHKTEHPRRTALSRVARATRGICADLPLRPAAAAGFSSPADALLPTCAALLARGTGLRRTPASAAYTIWRGERAWHEGGQATNGLTKPSLLPFCLYVKHGD